MTSLYMKKISLSEYRYLATYLIYSCILKLHFTRPIPFVMTLIDAFVVIFKVFFRNISIVLTSPVLDYE